MVRARRHPRRRVLLVSLALATIAAAIGGPWYVRSIERDLEARVPSELDGFGLDGIEASFRGQEGVLSCRTPLADPEAVLDIANRVDGVTLVTLDRSCRVSTAPIVEPSGDTPPDGGSPTTDGAPSTDARTDEADDEASSDEFAGFASVAELIDSTPRFSVFANLVEESGVDLDDLGGESGLTVFAPVDAAFDALPPDVVAELRTRPEMLAQVVRHHVVAGAVLGSDDLASIDGADLSDLLGPDRVDAADVVHADLRAANGVVHAIDRVLLPPDLELRALAGLPEVVAVLRAGTLDLAGSVPTEADRVVLIAAAYQALAVDNVVHDLVVDPEAEIGARDLAALADLVEAAPVLLTTGSVGFDGAVFVRGIAVGAESRDEITERAGSSAAVEVALRPTASPDDMEMVEAELAEVLADRPLQFAPNTAELTDEAAATLDVLAAIAKQFAGTITVVEGHTDTAGNPQTNLDLSELRAVVVLFELAARGVPPAELDYIGRGGEEPVLVGGIEDPDASRRVELRIIAPS